MLKQEVAQEDNIALLDQKMEKMQSIYEKMGSLFVKSLGNQMTSNLVVNDTPSLPD